MKLVIACVLAPKTGSSNIDARRTPLQKAMRICIQAKQSSSREWTDTTDS